MLPRIFHLHRRVFGHYLSNDQRIMVKTRRSSALAQASSDETLGRPVKRAKLEELSSDASGAYSELLHFSLLFYSIAHLIDSQPKRTRKTSIKEVDKTLPERQSSLWKVGAHVSSAGGVENAVVNAANIGYVFLGLAF
jgi:AP endonuclease 1